MMAVLLVRATGKDVLMSPTPHFSDVPATLSYYGHVERLADAASWTGTCQAPPTAGCDPVGPQFCPTALCTRAMVAVFLCRACGHAGACLPAPAQVFSDVRVAAYCQYVQNLAIRHLGRAALRPPRDAPPASRFRLLPDHHLHARHDGGVPGAGLACRVAVPRKDHARFKALTSSGPRSQAGPAALFGGRDVGRTPCRPCHSE